MSSEDVENLERAFEALESGDFEAVTARKREKLRRLAQAFLLGEARALREAAVRDVRFDVASVTIGDGDPAVHVYEDAF